MVDNGDMDVLDEVPMKSNLTSGLSLLRGGIWCNWMLFRGFGGFAKSLALSGDGGIYVSETTSGVPIVDGADTSDKSVRQHLPYIIEGLAVSGLVHLDESRFDIGIRQTNVLLRVKLLYSSPILPGKRFA
jgi:hypothetical protein